MTSVPQADMRELRKGIDELDKQLIGLLAKRQELAKRIGDIKADLDLPVEDPKRELQIRTLRRHLCKELELDPIQVEMVFEQILVMSKGSQESLRRGGIVDTAGEKLLVGIMGGIGSFSEAAALQYLKDHQATHFQLSYPISTENVLSALATNAVDLGIFPIINSTAGLVIESIHACARHQFQIDDIFDVDVIHCLMAQPGVRKKDIRRIMSHPQALSQCKGYLKREFPNARLVEATDTAEGARLLEQQPEERELAVIASERCAELYHLEVLEKGIQDLKHNVTTFIAASRRRQV